MAILTMCCNNDVVSFVQAAGKHHVLRQAAIDSVKAGSAYWADQFDFLDRYFDPFTSYQTHRRLYRFAGVLRDGLGKLAGRKRVLSWLFNFQLRKFEPMNESLATMEPLEALPRKLLSVKDISWRV